MVAISFERNGNIKETMGVGRIGQAIELLGIEYRWNADLFEIPPKQSHIFLRGLESGDVLWEILDSVLQVPVRDGDMFKIKFVLSKTPYVDMEGYRVSAGMDLRKFRTCGKDFKYEGIFYNISEAPKINIT